MKVIAVGGAGGMGRPTLLALAQSGLVSEIVMADKDLEAAQRSAAATGDKVSARELLLESLD